MMEERPNEIALTAAQWLMRRQKQVSLRASRRVFVRCMAQQMPGEKKYRDEWDRLYTQFSTPIRR